MWITGLYGLMKYISLIFSIIIFLQGCGAIFTGTEQKVRVHLTEGSHHQFFLNGQQVHDSNGFIIIDKKVADNFLTIKTNGYQDINQYYSRDVNPLALTGDALWLIGAPVALLIDFCTGGVYKIEPEDIRIVLRKKQ